MAGIITAKWRNKDRLFKKLADLSPAMMTELTDANRQTASDMADIARNNVPVQHGDLRDSIVITGPGQVPPSHAQGAGPGVVPPGAYAVTVGNTKVRYGAMVEYGTSEHTAGGMFKGASIPKIPAHPFFWPAYRLVRKRHKPKASRAINKAIKKVAAR